MENIELYEMNLHERVGINHDMWIMRVPGGWIYNVSHH